MSFIPKTVKIFYSFSPADRSLRQNLDDALFNLKHKHKIITLPEDELELAGLNAKEQINNDLKESDIILLLISQDFFANNEFYEDVIRIAAERYTANEAKVVPVLLRSCDWEPMPFGESRSLSDLTYLPDDGKAVMGWKDRDEAFTNIAERLRGLIEKEGRIEKPRPIPDLLPYLCNRSRQERTFRTAISRWRGDASLQSSSANRPFVCIVHGNDDECHEKFRKRMVDITLPRILWPQSKRGVIDSQLLELPEEYINSKNPLDFLGSELGWAMANDPEASPEVIRENISNPVMFYSLLDSENWKTEGQKMVEAYLNFWNALPDMPPERVIACLLFSYKCGGDFEEKYREINQKARGYFKGLESAIGDYKKISGVVLPELEGVPLRDVERWISNGENFIGLCSKHPGELCRADDAIYYARIIYEKKKADKIPMYPLAKELFDLLKQNCCEWRT